MAVDPPSLLSLATAVPGHRLDQADVVELGRTLFPAFARDEPERFAAIYSNAEIDSRYSCVPLDWYRTHKDFTVRNALYVEHAVDLLAEVTETCLAQAGVTTDALGGIVVVSSTGVATPSLDALLMERMNLPRGLSRLPVFGLGCAGGVLGLARTAALAQSEPDKLWLFLCIELCGLTFRPNDSSKSNLIATALFGDGAAAALIGCRPGGRAIGPSGEHTWPGSLDVMGWRVSGDGLGVLFSRDIPTLIRERFGEAARVFLERQGLGFEDVGCFVAHPGGAKVLTAMERVYGLAPGGLRQARDVLRAFGNMSAVTVLFVLQQALADGEDGRLLLSALGPGFTAGFLLIDPRPDPARR
jgi:alkylresorcinol/alkylpyrone synthase